MDDGGNVNSPTSSPRMFEQEQRKQEPSSSSSGSSSSSSLSSNNNNPWVDGGRLHPVQRAWWLAARCDGRCGQLLGQAAARGLPWVRSWVASLVVWKGSGRVTELSRCDPFLHDPRYLSVAQVSRELDRLLATVSSGGGSDQSAAAAAAASSSSSSAADQSSDAAPGAADASASLPSDLVEVKYVADMFRYLASRLRVASHQAAILDKNNGSSSGGGGGGGFGRPAPSKALLGTLIPLHCGHNAAYSDEEREMLSFHLEKAIRSWTHSE